MSRKFEPPARTPTSNWGFGRPDPFCWLAVVPLLLAGVGAVIVGAPWIGIAMAIVAMLILLFDSWVNRDSSPAPRR